MRPLTLRPIRSWLWSLLIFLILGSIATTGCRQKFQSLGIDLTVDQRTLNNGLIVVMIPDHTVPIVSYQTWYRVGSVDERPGVTGISHLFEHLMFKGTTKNGPKAFFQKLEAKGAEVNAFTTRDYTVYHETFVPDLFEQVVELESDRMQNLKVDETALSTERQVVLEERRMRTDNSPAGKIQEALWALAYRRHPYRWPVIGYPGDLESLTVSTLQDWYRVHYQPGNAILVVVGDFNPDAAFEMIRKFYSLIPGRPKPAREIIPEPTQNEERRLVLRDDVASERFAQAYHVTAADHDDSYALDVLANILFEGNASRAYREIVEENDLALAITGSAYTPTYPGLFIVSGVMKQGVSTSEVETVLNRVIQGVQEKGVTPEEIQVAVKQLTVQLVDSVRTPHGLGQLIGTIMTVFGDPGRFAKDLEKYTKVTGEDVKRVALKYLIPNNRSIVTLVPDHQGQTKK